MTNINSIKVTSLVLLLIATVALMLACYTPPANTVAPEPPTFNGTIAGSLVLNCKSQAVSVTDDGLVTLDGPEHVQFYAEGIREGEWVYYRLVDGKLTRIASSWNELEQLA